MSFVPVNRAPVSRLERSSREITQSFSTVCIVPGGDEFFAYENNCSALDLNRSLRGIYIPFSTARIAPDCDEFGRSRK